MRRGNRKIKLLIGAAIILFTVFQYYSNSEVNEYTGKKQQISMTVEEEIAIGVLIAPQMAQHFGGLYPDQNFQKLIDKVGQQLVENSIAKKALYKYDFHLLKDSKTINAFALPGGQIFITYAFFSKLENEDQLAGVLSHEIAHVIGRHFAERIEKQGLTQVVLSGVNFGFTPNKSENALDITYFLKMNYNVNDELESDKLSIKIMIDAGYNPIELIEVMKLLKEAAKSTKTPERLSTHPDPENKIENIKKTIEKYKK